jgi:hypothetical protein
MSRLLEWLCRVTGGHRRPNFPPGWGADLTAWKCRRCGAIVKEKP